MSSRGDWGLLGLKRTADVTAIRRAYAARLKAMDPDADPDGFAALRGARDRALRWARANPAVSDAPTEEVDSSARHDGRDEPSVAETGEPPVPPAEPMFASRLSVPLPPGMLDATLDEPVAAPPPPPAAPPQVVTLALGSAPLDSAPVVTGDADHAVPAFQAHPDPVADIVAILAPQGEPPFPPVSADEEALIVARFDEAMRQLADADVTEAAHAEGWWARAIASTLPRSHALIAPAVAAFGWDRFGDTIHSSPAHAEVMQRHRELAFVDAIERPGHRLHRAYRELTRPEGQRSPLFNRPGKRIAELLQTIRRDYPGVEQVLEPYRVGQWEHRPSGPGLTFWQWIIIGWIAVVVLRGVGGLIDTTSSSEGTPPPITYVGALRADDSLARLGIGLTLQEIRAADPDFAVEIDTLASEARGAGSGEAALDRAVTAAIDRRVAAARGYAPPQALASWLESRATVARALASDNPTACIAFLMRGEIDEALMTDTMRRTMREGIRDMLLAAPASAAETADRFTIPGGVFNDTVERSGLSPQRVSAALGNDGTTADQCTTRIALIDAVLAMPVGTERTNLLRAL